MSVRARSRGWFFLSVAAGVAMLAMGACERRSVATSPYLDTGDRPRDIARALALNAEASRLGPEKKDEAEALLRRALAADLYCGPAHNNLGVLLLDQGRLYEAAEEFEWARKLLPGHPSPRVNLAMTLEKAGKTDQALDAYDAALAVYDGFLPAVQGKARLLVGAGRADAKTVALLDEIALRGDEQWRAWATLWAAKLQHR